MPGSTKIKPTLLIVNPVHQFGYGAGYAYYPHYLKEQFDVDFICHDEGQPKVEDEGFDVAYFNPVSNNNVIRTFHFAFHVIGLTYRKRYDSVLCVHYSLSFLIGWLVRSRNRVVDIRTGSLNRNPLLNWLANLSYKAAVLPFNRIVVLSHSLKERLKLPVKKTRIVPLGGVPIDKSEKSYDALNLVYVGVFTGRKLDVSIRGLKRYMDQRESSVHVHYDIIGFGTNAVLAQLNGVIEESGLENIVKVHKQLNHNGLADYFKRATVGVAFIPITPFFDVQPSTKIFEYALSGLITLATDTLENALVISPENGLLCEDTELGFSEALMDLETKLSSFSADRIKDSMADYHWESIINNRLAKILSGDE